jgi:aerotaxis receptor
LRVNHPVTKQEYPFPKGETLVSTTDTKGRILYCNPMFIEVSGYAKEELLGQPHNLIRHPDMPEEAFRDMWDTIQKGLPWSAPVKNRRKNGDYYWVMANATPLLDERGAPAGYMSVRTEATREQIQAAEKLYADMRREKEMGRRVLTLQHGRLIKNTAIGRLTEALRLGLSARLFLALLAMLVASVLVNSLLPDEGMAWKAAGYAVDATVLFSVWFFLTRLLVRPLNGLITAANRMASGDLTRAIENTRSDELGSLEKALSQLNVNLLSIVRDAREQSQLMLGGASEIAQGNLDLSSRTESQASNLEQTAASMEEMTGTVRQTADSAKKAAELSSKASGIAEKGNGAVIELGETMKEIQSASSRISEITQVIDSIAFQTNILALNAAVEAARAGDQGRGFAVVASEVRSLAQRTSTAAKEIKVLIENSATKVEEGHQKSLAAQTTMSEAVDGVRQVTVIVNEISAAANEQLSGISQINSAVAQLDTITQQNAALVEEMAASTQALEGTATAVTETVQVFRIDRNSPLLAGVGAVELRKSMKALRSPEGEEQLRIGHAR